MTQNEMVLDHLRKKPITQYDALREYGIMRLASRISDLRAEGHKITTTTETIKNRYGKKVSHAVYTLRKEADNG